MKNFNQTEKNLEFEWLKYATGLSFQQNDSRLKSFGYSAEETFFKISFDDVDYFNMSELNWYYDIKYGNCYRIGEQTPLLVDSSSFGLKIEIFTGVPESNFAYLYQPESSGLIVEIKDPDGYPYFFDGIYLQPGTHSDVSLFKKSSQLMSPPYSNCYNPTPPPIGVLAHIVQELSLQGIAYSRRVCLEIFAQFQFIQELSCYDLRLPSISNARACNRTFMAKLDEIFRSVSAGPDVCPIDCQSNNYDIFISMSEYPSEIYFDKSLDEFGVYFELLFGVEKNKITHDLVKKSFTSAFIHFDQLVVTQISESPTNNQITFLNNFGGILGMFMGLSLISAAEVLELSFFVLLFFGQAFFYKIKWK